MANVSPVEDNPSQQEATLVVTGLHCSSCAGAVQRAVSRSPGVSSADLTFATEKLAVVYDPSKTDVAYLKAVVERTGYGALMPEELEERRTAHIRDLQRERRRLTVALVLGTPVFAIMIWRWMHPTAVFPALGWIMFVLDTPLQLFVGYRFYRGAWLALWRGRTATTDVLIALGSSAAYFYSVAALVWLHRPTYFDTAALVVTFVTIGNFLKVNATYKASAAIRNLVDLQARYALKQDAAGQFQEVPIDHVRAGDRVQIRAGDTMPVDGEVVHGTSTVDESMLTGEPMPVTKGPGDKVTAATVNQYGTLILVVTRVGRETLISQIIDRVESAQAARTPLIELTDRLSRIFVPIILVIAIGTFLGWWLFSGVQSALLSAVAHSVAILVIACPCALTLAPGTALAVASGEAARMGVLVKNGAVWENLYKAETVAFDKTGTLTEGKPTVARIWAAPSHSEGTVLKWAASAEQGSQHPLADAVRKAAALRDIEAEMPDDFETAAGLGITASVAGHAVKVGSPRFLEADSPADSEALADLASEGLTAVAVSLDGQYLGVMGIGDRVRAEAAAVIGILKAQGIHVAMITGDQRAAAQHVADLVGIGEVMAEVLPDGKADAIDQLRHERSGPIIMVGDGINDAPALAAADMGIAMGSGSDIAGESADVTLLQTNLRRIPEMLSMSRFTRQVIRQNFFWAFVFNGIGLPIAALGYLNPIVASSAMGFSSFAVVTNSMRLRRRHARPRTVAGPVV